MTRILEQGDIATAIDQQLADDTSRARSVVKAAYKIRYAERAKEAKGVKGVSKKVLARSCGDWLAIQIAKLCNTGKKGKLDIATFTAILDANGVEHAKWNNSSKGWQGRFRMTGRLALEKVVAEAEGEFELPSGETLVAPKSWVAKHTH